MLARQKTFLQLQKPSIFSLVTKYKQDFLQQNPKAELLNLSIGDTTQPLSAFVTAAIQSAAARLGTKEGYVGYGCESGQSELKEKIAERIYQGKIRWDEITISDGAKGDIARLQTFFGPRVSIAVENPTYPSYIDGSIAVGVRNITILPNKEGLSDFTKAPNADLFYLCMPNNPTGKVWQRQDLCNLVDFARENRIIIIYDAAYSQFIRDSLVPKTIYAIEGADRVAIEVQSFSKIAGFTGLRLGWCVIPHALKYRDGVPISADWHRLLSAHFNGASNVVQAGGIAALSDQGWKEVHSDIDFYLKNSAILKKALQDVGFEVHGGENAPYLWVNSKAASSWPLFHKLLQKAHILTIPGEGFGSGGSGFLRFSAFSKRSSIEMAAERLQRLC